MTTLQDKIKDAQDQLVALEGTSAEEKTALEKQIEALQGKLNTARAEVLTLSGEKASLKKKKRSAGRTEESSGSGKKRQCRS